MQVATRVEGVCFQLFRLKYDELLSSLAFNYKLRPCRMGRWQRAPGGAEVGAGTRLPVG